jgi:4-hydroxyacetophenone monooxygenase
LEANAVISGVGQLNRPKLPGITGRDRFVGPSFHTAQWDHSVDLRGKRVAVIGTGASGIQCIPAIAGDVAELLVFQRTPNWFIPVPEYHDPLPAGLRWLFERVPHYCQWYRFVLFWWMAEGLLAAARIDPEWMAQGKIGSEANEVLRAWLGGYLEEQFADAPELREHVIPTYPPLAKRPLLDNGSWAGALTRENVTLVTEKITEITPHAIATSDGREHEVDVIVYATGFHASRFLTPMRVIGRDGVDLHEHWDGDARAYLGMTLPGFPNFFCLYGPNTNIVANGSIIFFSEAAVHYILGCIRLLLEGGYRTMDCRREVHDDYNARIDEGNRNMVWGASEVNSWYKNERGRVTQCWPFSLLEFWQRTREPTPADYEFS